jgi:hypothetical protein
MYTRTYRLVTALEVTFWLVLLLIFGIVQPQPQGLNNPLPLGQVPELLQLPN